MGTQPTPASRRNKMDAIVIFNSNEGMKIKVPAQLAYDDWDEHGLLTLTSAHDLLQDYLDESEISDYEVNISDWEWEVQTA